MTAHDRRRARDRRGYEASLLKALYPALSWQHIGLVLKHARNVRLLGGGSLESALGR